MVYHMSRLLEITIFMSDKEFHSLSISSQKLDRSTLSTQAADLLRDAIIRGEIPPGTKIVERQVAKMLEISRAPARDALMTLEKEGLVISRPDARYVIELTERDVNEMHQVRLVLELLAIDLAAQNTSEQNQKAQIATLKLMEDATKAKDRAAFSKADLEGHAIIWKQSDNHNLEKTLQTMIGPIFMFMATATEYYDWDVTLDLHRDMVKCINAGDREAAKESMIRHMENSRKRAVGIINAKELEKKRLR